MKKLSYLIVLVLILGLALAGCTFLSNIGQAPATDQSGITYLTKSVPLLPNLVGLWHFNEGEGVAANDSSGNSNHGTVYGASWDDGQPGFGKALSFDGDDYISVDDSTSLDAIVDLTVELWLNPAVTYDSDAPDAYVFLSKFGTNGFQFVYHPDGYLYLYVTGGMAVRSSVQTLNAGTWYHLAATFDSGTADSHIYVNKVDVTSSTTTQNMTTNDCPLFVGARPCPTPTYPRHFVRGIIDEVRIWNVALSPDQLGFVYDFGGILPPINEDGNSVFKLGRTVPVKFQLRDADEAFITDAVARISIAQINEGVVGTEVEAISTSAATTGNLFRYDFTSDQYIFNLATNSLSVGTWKIKIELDDGTSQFVTISLR